MSHRRQVAFVSLLLVLFSIGVFAQKRPYSPPPTRYPQRTYTRPSVAQRPVPSPRITNLLRNRPNIAIRNNRSLPVNRGMAASRSPLRLAAKPKLASPSAQLAKRKASQSAVNSNSAVRRTNFTVPKLTTAQRTNMSSRLAGLRGRLMASSAGSSGGTAAGGGGKRPPGGGSTGGGGEPPNSSGDPSKRNQLIAQLKQNGVKHSPENIVSINTNAKGKILFLEKGNSESGLKHIVDNHAEEFEAKGISREQIPDAVMTAATKGKQIGFQGRDRPIYEVEFNGKTQRIAVQTGSNGYIVSANPSSSR